MAPTSRHIVADNIRALLQAAGWSNRQLGARSGVSDRMIGKILRDDGSEPTTVTLDKIAAAFGVEPWQLLMPNGHEHALMSKNFRRVADAYANATQDGRAIMESQADYLLGQKPANHDPGGPPRKKRSSRS